MKKSALAVIVLLIAAAAIAQAAAPELVLVPIVVNKIHGAHSSLWSSELRVHNSSDSLVSFAAHSCTLGFCTFLEVPAHGSAIPLVAAPGDVAEYPGVFLQVDPSDLSALTFSLRVFDESRSSENWGSALPVVRWNSVRPSTLRFLGVPATAEFRSLVRVYALTRTPGPVTVSYFNDELPGSGPLLQESARIEIYFRDEGYAQIPVPEPSFWPGVGLLRIEVAADDATLPIWGFVSVTNNDTQAVAFVTSPQLDPPD